MATYKQPIRYVDKQGRVVLPAHVRKHLNIGTGNVIELVLNPDKTVTIKAVPERCCVCGDAIGEKHHTEIQTDNGGKCICFGCAQTIAKAMMK